VRIVLTQQLRQRKRDCTRVVTYRETVEEFGPNLKWVDRVRIMDIGILQGCMRTKILP